MRGHFACELREPARCDIISLWEQKMQAMLIPVSPGWSFRLTEPVNEAIVFHMQAGPGSLWEQQFGCKDYHKSLLIFSPQETGCLHTIS